MSASVAGPEAVAYLERILGAQTRLVELQEAQVKLLERFLPAVPPPPGVEPPAQMPVPTVGLATADAGARGGQSSAAEPAPGRGPLAELREELQSESQSGGSESESEELSEAEVCHRRLVQSASRLTRRLPVALWRFLVALGVLSPLEISEGWRRAVYQTYQAIITTSVVFTSVIVAVHAYFTHAVLGTERHAGDVMFVLISLYFRLFIVLPSIFVWRRQFSPRGGTLALIRCMHESQFPWEELRIGIRLAWCLTVCGVIFTFWTYTRAATIEAKMALESEALESDSSVTSGQQAFLFLEIANRAVCIPFTFVFLGSHYLVVLTGRLHRHDLLCYADAMAKAIESGGVASHVVQKLNRLELLVGARLRDASHSWVPFMLHDIVFCLVTILIAGMFMFAGEKIEVPGVGWFGVFVPLSALTVILLAPMAHVAKTFEHDVVTLLNTPSTLNGSQKYFGQQLLSHLNTLNWGFRVGGQAIGQNYLSQISTALLIGVLASASSAVQSEFAVRLQTHVG